MKSVAIGSLCLLLLGAAAAAAVRDLDEHPMEKLIGLLKDLMEKVKSEGQDEGNTYDKFMHWCKNSEKTLQKAVVEEKATIEELTATVDGKKKEIATAEAELAELEDQIMKAEAADAEAGKGRDEARKLYEAADKDFADTIDAIDQAIAALEKAKGDVKAVQLSAGVRHTLSLVQALAPPETRPALAALLQQVPVKKYKFKSGNVIELLKQLKIKFEDDKLEATKAETNASNNYELAKEARKHAIEAAKSAKGEKTQAKADAESALADAEKSLEDTRQDLEADSAALEQTQKTCSMKSSEWEERAKTRELELEAMAKAIEIISKVTGVRTEAPENPVPPPSPVASEAPSFLQLGGADPKMKAVNFLRARAQVLRSRELERLAQQVKAHLGDPFDEVKQMIQKMIFRLMAEQKDEDDHKNWCDLELEKTNSSKTSKNEKIAELSAKIDEDTAKIQKLADDIVAADEMVAKIDAHTKEATEIRTEGKQENAEAIKDAEDATAAIAKAVAVLEDFYKDSGMMKKEPWEFLQAPVDLPEQPSTWDASYTGVADPKAQPEGVITIMQKISADFDKMKADTRAQEVTDQKAYDDDMKDCAVEKARRAKESEMKQQEKKRLEDKVDTLTKRKKGVSDELYAVEQYLKDLEPACVTGDSTYEERKAARAKEIDALKEAQGILEDAFKEGSAPAPAFLQIRRHEQH